MKKSIITLSTVLGLSSTLLAGGVSATSQDIRAFVLPSDTMSLKLSYNRANDAIDFLNINDAADPLVPYSALGDSSGMDLSVGYGIHPFISLYYNIQALNIHYAGGEVKNIKNDLYARVNFYDVPHYSFDDFSMDIGYVRNASDDFNNLSDLSDNSYYIRLLLGSRFSSSLLNFYTGFKYSSINTAINNIDAGRNEKSLMLGISHTIEFSRFILDSRYEYSRIFDRESTLSENKSNSVFDINLAYAYHDSLLFFIGTTIMFNQFNGLIPYLYNSQTQVAFDKTYSYAKLGFVYNFDFQKDRKTPLSFADTSCQKKESTTLFSFFGW